MKKVKLCLFNHSRIEKIADFRQAHHDAYTCMKHLNDNLIKAHKELPLNIFYFLYGEKLQHPTAQVDYTTPAGQISITYKHVDKVYTHLETYSEVKI